MAQGDRILSQQEVDALLRAINEGQVAIRGREAPPVAVTPIDFRRPQRLSRQDLHALHAIHEPLAPALRDLVAPILRAGVECTLAGVEQVTLGEYVDSATDPTALAVAAVEPGGQAVLLEVDPLLAFPLVERMLGAGGPVAEPPARALREIEWNLLGRVIDRVLDAIAACWAHVLPARLVRRAQETSPQAVRQLMPDGAMVRVGLLVDAEGRRSGVSLCVPASVAERLVQRSEAGPAAPDRAGLTAAVEESEVEVTARLPVEGMLLSDLEALSKGDVLVTSQPANPTVVIDVGGLAKLAGRAGKLGSRRAVLTEEWVDAGRALRLSQPAGRVERRPGRGRPRAPDWGRVLAAPVEVRAVVARREVALREVLDLRPGSVLATGRGASDPVELEAGGRAFATGAAVRVGERAGVQVRAIQEAQKTLRSLGG